MKYIYTTVEWTAMKFRSSDILLLQRMNPDNFCVVKIVICPILQLLVIIITCCDDNTGWHGGAAVSTVSSQHEGSGFLSAGQPGAFLTPPPACPGYILSLVQCQLT